MASAGHTFRHPLLLLPCDDTLPVVKRNARLRDVPASFSCIGPYVVFFAREGAVNQCLSVLLGPGADAVIKGDVYLMRSSAVERDAVPLTESDPLFLDALVCGATGTPSALFAGIFQRLGIRCRHLLSR